MSPVCPFSFCLQGVMVASILCILSIHVGYRSCDTRPYRSRHAIAYAGCMTVALAKPVDRVYASRPSYRQRLWLQRATPEIIGHLVQFSREAGHGLGNALYKVAKVAKWSTQSTRNIGNKVARIQARLDTLFGSPLPSTVPRRVRGWARE